MLFSDPLFLFVFLPIAFILFHGVRVFLDARYAIWVLIGLSATFYGIWSVQFLALIVGQIGVNYLFAQKIQRSGRKYTLLCAVLFNLALLGYFKYRNFFIENISYLFQTDWANNLTALVIPLGISFHSFQQIALLVDVADEEAEAPTLKHLLMFVLFFPQLIAGPIVLDSEMSRQIADVESGKGPGFRYLGPGFMMLVFGLFKKVVIADTLAPFVNLAFHWPDQPLQPLEAWTGVIGYALQLYFDFSGYSDMAIGLALMFGFILPFNFDTPFAATSMIEYWKRWHITMTRFFTMYIYTPLALNFSRFVIRGGYGKFLLFFLGTIIPTIITFLASGLWHGAGWTFIAFGLVNTIGLVINHSWKQAGFPALPKAIAWGATALTILVSFVYFRAKSIEHADYILAAMLDVSHIAVPDWASGLADRFHLTVEPYNVFFKGSFTLRQIAQIIIAAALSVLLPNPATQPLTWRPTNRVAFACAAMLWLTLGSINEPRTFLYFQF